MAAVHAVNAVKRTCQQSDYMQGDAGVHGRLVAQTMAQHVPLAGGHVVPANQGGLFCAGKAYGVGGELLDCWGL
jgi:hypothetical protein